MKQSSDSQSNTMFASLVMKPICDFYDSVYMDLDRDRLQGMRKQIKVGIIFEAKCVVKTCLFLFFWWENRYHQTNLAGIINLEVSFDNLCICEELT